MDKKAWAEAVASLALTWSAIGKNHGVEVLLVFGEKTGV